MLFPNSKLARLDLYPDTNKLISSKEILKAVYRYVDGRKLEALELRELIQDLEELL